MVNDRFFWPALRTTLLLMVIIIPLQFVLAIIMALVIQAQLRVNTFFLSCLRHPLGVSDLAVGIVWYAIFTQYGYLNSILQALGLIDSPDRLSHGRHPLLDHHRHLAGRSLAGDGHRHGRSSSPGCRPSPTEVLEAADLFGASLWQRLRYVILPLLQPSLQVALILRTILALQVFAVVIALCGGDVVTVLANETYRQYYDLRNINVAAAYAGLDPADVDGQRHLLPAHGAHATRRPGDDSRRRSPRIPAVAGVGRDAAGARRALRRQRC